MAEEEKEEKKSSKLLPIIIGAVGGIVLLLAGLALGFFLFSSPAADPSAEVDEIIEKSSEGEEEIENPEGEDHPVDDFQDENGEPVVAETFDDILEKAREEARQQYY